MDKPESLTKLVEILVARRAALRAQLSDLESQCEALTTVIVANCAPGADYLSDDPDVVLDRV